MKFNTRVVLKEFRKSWIFVIIGLFLGFTCVVWLSSGRVNLINAASLPPNAVMWRPNGHEGGVNETSTTRNSFGTAGLRGFVTKRGMIPSFYFTNSDEDVRRLAFDRWLAGYIKGNVGSHAPTPFPYCQVYINHHYKFIWIKGHKVASTAMRKPLGSLCGDNWKADANTSYEYCSEPLFLNNSTSISTIKKWWEEYFVFGIVRNPYTRFASAQEYVRTLFAKDCVDRPKFATACKEPYASVGYCKSNPCCWWKLAAHHYRHLMDQSTCLFTDSLLPAVDYLGETERLADDFVEIVGEINRKKDPKLPELGNELVKENVHTFENVNRVQKRNKKREGTYAYDLFKKHQSCLQPIYQFYHKDFMLLQYDPVGSISSTES